MFKKPSEPNPAETEGFNPFAPEDHLAPDEQISPSEEPTSATPEPTVRRVLDRLLDPRSLQMLMMTGGTLLVVGLVVWLWSIGLFENSLVVASVMGGANLAALAGGAVMVMRSRYQTAGRAIALLACLVLPLNLWFYDAQGLVTLNEGGHLWLPALAICCLYAATARLLKDSLFVYALVGGVTMTGLLFLADQQVGHFWEVLSPSMLLVGIGVLCVHAERLFASGDGPFSREKFGLAFFRSGHVAMSSGLAVLLGGRLVGRLYDPLFSRFDLFSMPTVATVANMKLFALALAVVGAYTYLYSLLVTKRGSRYAYSAILMLLWCEVIALDLFQVALTEQLLVALLASTALAANAVASFARRLPDSEEVAEGTVDNATGNPTDSPAGKLTAASGTLGTVFSLAALLVGSVQFVRGVFDLDLLPAFEFDWLYVAAMSMLAVAAATSVKLQTGLRRFRLANLSLQSAALAGVMAVTATLSLVGLSSLMVLLPLLGLVPLGLVLASKRVPGEYQNGTNDAAQVVSTFLLLLSVSVVLGLAPAAAGVVAGFTPLLLGLFFAEAALANGLVARLGVTKTNRVTAPVLSAMSCWASAWQLLLYFGFVTYAPFLAASVVGVVCLLADRLFSSTTAEAGQANSSTPLSGLAWAGYFMTVLGGVAGALLTFNRLVAGETEWELFALMLGQAGAAGLAALLAPTAGARRGLFALAGGQVLFGLLVVNVLSALTFGQRTEMFLTACGALLLVAGHVGWRRETQELAKPEGRVHSDSLVSFNLLFGSLLAAGPLVWGLLAQRLFGDSTGWAWVLMHEVGALAVGLTLLGAGVLCRVRSTTLVGTVTLLAYVGSLVTLINLPDQLQSVAVYMMVGGGAFFTVAVLLSVYRDRLLEVPERVRTGKGVFRVLNWR